MVKALEGKTYEVQLKSLGLFSPEETEGKLHRGLQLPQERSGGAGTDLFSLVTSDRTQGNGMKLPMTGEDQVGYQKKVLHEEGSWALEKALQGSGHSTELAKLKKCLYSDIRHME